MNFKRRFAILPLLAAWALAAAQAPPESELRQAELEAHLRFLASDELRGRSPVDWGGEVAAKYIEERFRALGLRTLKGLGGYRQRVPLEVTPEMPAGGEVTLLGEVFQAGEGLIVLPGPALRAEGEAVLAERLEGEGTDLQGRIVVTKFGDPAHPASAMAGLRAGHEKLAQAAGRGAAALVEVYEGGSFEGFVGFLGRRRLTSGGEREAPGIPHLIIHRKGLWGKLEQSPGPDCSVTVPARLPEEASSPNIVGWVEGSDPGMRGEYVMLMAHYDHLGADPDLPGATSGDHIFNGARDNAMGTVAVLGAAQALGKAPPKRSVLLAAITAEEFGMLGSRYFVENPPVPLEKIIFALNVDTGGYTDTDVVTVVGLERTTARQSLQRACADFGLEAIPNPAPEQQLFRRSDNIHLARRGIPAPTFSPGFRAWTPQLVEHYHRPSDEVHADFDFGYLLRFTQAYARAARLVADAPQAPRWAEGQGEFQEAYRKLYGPGN